MSIRELWALWLLIAAMVVALAVLAVVALVKGDWMDAAGLALCSWVVSVLGRPIATMLVRKQEQRR